MEIENLNKYFKGDITALILKEIISSEVGAYKIALEKKKNSIPIYISPIQREGVLIKLNKIDFKKLCDDYLNDTLNEFDIYYISDVISLSQNIEMENEEVEELFFGIGDPVVNGAISKKIIKKLLEELFPPSVTHY